MRVQEKNKVENEKHTDPDRKLKRGNKATSTV